jgi:hypothetical protein
MKVDVVVAGGGSAGIAAAISAARAGARVVLIERHGVLGGMASTSFVHSICGLYRLRPSESQPLLVSNPGFPMEFAEGLLASGGARGPIRMGRLDVLLHQPAAFAHLADRLMEQLSNLEVFFHSEISSVITKEASEITSLSISCRTSRITIEPKVVVDATGDAEISFLSGAAFETAPLQKLQRPAYIFVLGGVHPETMSDHGRLALAHSISTAVMEGHLPEGALGIAFRMGVEPGEVWATIDLCGENFDPHDPTSLSRIESEGRDLAFRVAAFLKCHAQGFQMAFISALPARAGIRESRRSLGHYQLTESDILCGSRFDDEVAYAAWPIELRETARGPRFRFPNDDAPCGIPLRSLHSQNVANLFMAGRCISCTHEAHASIRVIGTCLATGEAAGKAAAKMALSGHHP